jgi:hypothetical protein
MIPRGSASRSIRRAAWWRRRVAAAALAVFAWIACLTACIPPPLRLGALPLRPHPPRELIVVTTLGGVPLCMRVAKMLVVPNDAVIVRIVAMAPEGTPEFMRSDIVRVADAVLEKISKSLSLPTAIAFDVALGVADLRSRGESRHRLLARILSEDEVQLPVVVLLDVDFRYEVLQIGASYGDAEQVAADIALWLLTA